MLPDESLSSVYFPAPFLYPDSLPFARNRDYEMGGVALADGTMGLQVKPWTLFVDAKGNFLVGPLGASDTEFVKILTVEGADWAGLTFDRNMNIVLCWYLEEEETSYLYWYDTLAESYVTTDFPGVRSPRVCHDDKRQLAEASDDSLFIYIRDADNTLCFRAQRDRYEIEYELAELTDPKQKYLTRVGMGTKNRVIFELSSWAPPKPTT